MSVIFDMFPSKNKKKLTMHFLILSIWKTLRKAFRHYYDAAKGHFQRKWKFSFFIIFGYFSSFFHCTSHSRSRHTDFSWIFGDHHSIPFLSNFSMDNFIFSCELEAGGKPPTWFPPEGLVELSTPQNVPERWNSIEI